ncbi:hypothetical protein Q3G72_014881 [Acer saccharum]|nr:hypothetical protein Q3G72_014881 [Acer saccharum]
MCDMLDLQILSLRSNKFSDELPNCWHQWMLWAIDISNNTLSGHLPISFGGIPRCIGNLSGLVNGKNSEVFKQLIYVAIKGRNPEYSSIIAIVDSIDLSWNNLTGVIPDEVSSLSALHILNLSNNHLAGPIPPSLSSLTSLARLNLSYNNLAGRIPPLPKFVDPSIFEGNPSLCGAPLPSKCPGNSTFRQTNF